MSETLLEEKVNTEEDTVFRWWQTLEDNKGDRAELRRAKSINDVIMQQAFYKLWHKLSKTKWSNRESVALIAGVLSHVKENNGVPFAKSMADGEKPKVSNLRFRRFLKNETKEDVFVQAIKMVNLIDKTTGIKDLAKVLYWWNDKERKELAFNYYDTAVDKN